MKLIFKDTKTNNLLEINPETRDIKYHIFNDQNHIDKEVNNLINNLIKVITVKDNDDGIRPAGKPDECFYCDSQIGEYHKIDCVILKRINNYSVMMEGSKVGTLMWSDPISWDKDSCESHKNYSSWCVNNALEDIIWLKNKISKSIIKEIEKLDDELCCACGLLEFNFDKSENWLGKDQMFNFIGISKE